jgi:hypothetical protein
MVHLSVLCNTGYQPDTSLTGSINPHHTTVSDSCMALLSTPIQYGKSSSSTPIQASLVRGITVVLPANSPGCIACSYSGYPYLLRAPDGVSTCSQLFNLCPAHPFKLHDGQAFHVFIVIISAVPAGNAPLTKGFNLLHYKE